jgi:tetratricopeptide (TPR) repeat protein
MSRYLSYLLAVLLLVPAWAQPDFEASVQALRDGQDQAALTICQQLEQAGQASFGSLYNQGLALRNLGDAARARASFERALLLKPHDLATRKRLREIDAQLGEKVISKDVRGTPWWRAHEAELMLIFPGLLMLAMGVAWRQKGTRPSATPMLTVLLGGLGLMALVLLTSPPQHRAVVVEKTAHLLPEPQPGKAGVAVAAGTLVEILERSDHYLKVRLGDDQTGWLRKPQVVELTLPGPATSR